MPTQTQTDPKTSRERILETAARLFHEQGYVATGVATILREAGVNSGSLYHHFPSKEALLEAVLGRYQELLHPVVLAPAEAATDDPIERIFALLRWYRDGLSSVGWAMGCPIGNLALEVGDSLPDVRALIGANFEGWIAGVRGWLEQAGDRLPADLDADALARFVLTVMEGGVMQSRAEGHSRSFDASVAQLRVYFDLLQREAAHRAGRTSPEGSSKA